MPASQQQINAQTPLGATLVPGGATFRVFGPAATSVFVSGDFNGWVQRDPSTLLVKNGNYWGGFIPGIVDGTQYKFFVDGDGSSGFKRDPYAREIVPVPKQGATNCVVRDPHSYLWHDAGFRPPAFSDLIVYQLHVGTYFGTDGQGRDNRQGRDCTFLDVIDRIEYLAALGVNAIEPLPVCEFETETSLGYNGSDYYAPEFRYTIPAGDPRLPRFVTTINRLLAQRGKAPIAASVLDRPLNQLKVLVDLCHIYGMAVLLDVVYNHAGGFGGDDESIFFWDRQKTTDNNQSLYFTNVGYSGGLIFAYWNQDVRQFLINNAIYFGNDYHVDGFRFDEVTVIDFNGGHQFAQDLTGTLKFLNPSHPLIAEYWADQSSAVRDTSQGGLGFDAVWSAGLRETVRTAIGQASAGQAIQVSLDPIAGSLNRPPNFPAAWKSVVSVETHDEVFEGRSPRIPRLADGSNARSWYARSRSRVATGLVLTSPGIPMLFMGEEFLEDKPWSDNNKADLIFWDGLNSDRSMIDFLRFTRELVALRRRQPALRGEGVKVFHVHNDNRVIAFQRWVEGIGRDVVVVASLNESTFWNYALGFPGPGHWLEVFNSDVYDNWVNPIVAGNGGGIEASGGPLHGLNNSSSIVIPANGFVVFARDGGD
jgi:1,4-alpha-glucan branching enzyme